MRSPLRPGDVLIAPHGANLETLPALTVVGRVHSGHATTIDAPKNPADARSKALANTATAWLEIDTAFRPGLVGLAAYSHIIVLGWLHQARRDLIQITRPKDGEPAATDGTGQPKVQATGVFALRSPVRPNPVSVSVARILAIDVAAGRIDIDAIDLLDGTPIVDLKPYRPGIDAVPHAVVP